MSKAQRRVKTEDMNGVRTLGELQSNISRIGGLQTVIEQKTAEANAKIEAIKEALKLDIKNCNDEIKVLSKGCQIYFTANQAEFVPAGKKSAKFDCGEIGTRTTPLSVTIKKDQTIQLIDKLKEMGLEDCIDVSESVNKNALKKCRKDVEGLPGITFNQREEFFIAPEHVPVEHLSELDKAS